MLTVKLITYFVTVITSVLLVTFQKQTDHFLAKMLTISIFFMNIAGCVLLFKNHYFGPLHYMSVTIMTALTFWFLFGKFTGNKVNTVKFIILLIVASGVIFLSI
jgi:hypothetical protein